MLHPQKPPKHDHLLRHTECRGHAKWMDLAHSYETDLLTLDLKVPGLEHHQSTWKSLLYAVLEAACETLELSRDDIGGTLTPNSDTDWSLVLFDAVPGGAGHVLMVEAQLERVLRAAFKRVRDCECGPETSCYACLRSYGNQRDHEDLSRGDAAAVLSRLLEAGGAEPISESDDVSGLPPEWHEVYESALPDERALLRELAIAGVPVPTVGHETTEGLPLPVSWPEFRVALSEGLTDDDMVELSEAGWTLVDHDAADVVDAIALASAS